MATPARAFRVGSLVPAGCRYRLRGYIFSSVGLVRSLVEGSIIGAWCR